MQPAHESGPRRRSAFVAAFLSLLFPGLGHAYLGAHRRALGFAAPPILLGALIAGILVRLDVFDLAGLAVQTWFIATVFVGNLIALAYRGAAIVDAWRIARWLDAGAPRVRRPRGAVAATAPLSIAGLAAVLLVMSVVHVAIARYDLLLAGTTACIFDPDATDCEAAPTPSADGSAEPTDGAPDSPEPSAVGTPVPSTSIPPWDGRERLNVLLIGADEQGGGHNTDTLIMLSIDPATNQVAMFQLPRDTVDVPVPEGPARQLWGSVYRGKINAWFVQNRHREDLFPGTDQTRGYNALKAILGELYQVEIKYFVEVNFDGFRQIVDALGGVTINVQVPVLDDRYPAGGGALARVYIASGMQRMTGAEALVYARSRHGSTDFDRGARQQRVLLSLRQQTDIASVLPRIDELASAMAASVRTDIPRELLPQLLGLAAQVDTPDVRSYIFTPPFYQVETLNDPQRGYMIQPRLDRIRAAVRDAFTTDPGIAERREQLGEEGATVYVLNGSGQSGQAARIAAYLEYLGMSASAPGQRPDVEGAPTIVRVYNGAEASMPLTVATLEGLFGVTAELVDNATATADIVVITGTQTPSLTPPPAP
ncbi:MAG TPA: LCP family protein [Candidatus Limnocylindrales bacterium]|nr:LCP family protein [Candidatus Limnocylindrales bacterium]